MSVQIVGLERLRAKLRDRSLVEGPLDDLIRDAGLAGDEEADRWAPVLTGELRDRITFKAHRGFGELRAGAPWSIFQEAGTSRGVKGRRFMRHAAEAAKRAIESGSRKFASAVERRWGS